MGLLELVIVILVIAWVGGAVVVPVGSAIHVLAVVVLVLIAVRLVQGRRV